jgi:hypothetical protein
LAIGAYPTTILILISQYESKNDQSRMLYSTDGDFFVRIGLAHYWLRAQELDDDELLTCNPRVRGKS